MVEAATTRCKEAGEALTFSIVGLLIPGCWIGIIFQVIAISKSVKAKKMMRDNPSLSGWGKTNAAILLGAIGLLFSVLQIVSRVGG